MTILKTDSDIKFTMSANLTPTAVEALIRKLLQEKTGKKVASVTFKIRNVADATDRYNTTVFDGCTVTFEDEYTK